MNREFDLLIVGGGVNGCGLARDAAGRGLCRRARRDRTIWRARPRSWSTRLEFMAGCAISNSTSSASSANRYLERETLWAIAPHIIHPLRFVLPHHRGLRPAWMLRASLRSSGRPQTPAADAHARPDARCGGRAAEEGHVHARLRIFRLRRRRRPPRRPQRPRRGRSRRDHPARNRLLTGRARTASGASRSRTPAGHGARRTLAGKRLVEHRRPVGRRRPFRRARARLARPRQAHRAPRIVVPGSTTTSAATFSRMSTAASSSPFPGAAISL